MSPRPYSMEKRVAVSNETRLRILEAARQALAQESEADLTMDAIARRADVSRLTIYYQFKSRPGLLEALYDYLASRGGMKRMPEVFREPNPSAALDKLVDVFVGFWSSDRVVIRRLRAMAALDAEIARGIHSRDTRRRHIAGEILKRMAAAGKKKYVDDQLSAAADVITVLTGFATYDALASAGHSEREIIATIARLVHFAAS
ncbi:MAG TPA: TetR/AcrR family transcriptional regulator [Terriglobales bacterium]|nr:TetR/AcrR family transcriptional regulator [Terriglobales bacterium]